MVFGYCDRIAHVYLSENVVTYEKPGEHFFRKYMGGGCLGSYYVNKFVKPGTDAFEPENVIVFSASIITGAPVPGFSRHSVTSISPLTGGVMDSQAGGYWGVELKFAGIDSIVVHGVAKKPVYLFVKDGKVEIRNATHLWGKSNLDALNIVESETKENKVRFLGIGVGGENLVRYACIMSDTQNANGRGGFGAVLGSKNLKGIAVKGNKKINIKEPTKVLEIAKNFAKKFRDIPGTKGLNAMGTTAAPLNNSNSGMLPTLNWRQGSFDKVENISGVVIHNTILAEKKSCYACPVRCKRTVKLEKPYKINPDYASIEYESLAALGSYLGIDDLHTVCKAIEICNEYAIDTISTGGTIAFAMECYENGFITKKDTEGLELRFGNKDVIVPIIYKIIRKEGIGKILAEGTKRASMALGEEVSKFALHCKGIELPAHEPRVKKSLSLTYAICPNGADHMASEHDTSICDTAPELFLNRISPLGINKKLPLDDLSIRKVMFTYYSMMAYSFLDSLDVCMFCMAPTRAMNYNELIDAIIAITGWEISLWELMKLGERRLNLMRAFNVQCGLTAKEDKLPLRLFTPLENGRHKGKSINKKQFERALKVFYKLSGWNDEGIPEDWKLKELGIK